MYFKQITEPKLAHNAYLIGCQTSGEAILFDPMRDTARYQAEAETAGLKIVAVAETHIHADYLSGARQFAHDFGVKVYVSDEGDSDWKYEWLSGSSYKYQLLKDGDQFGLGNVRFEVRHTPGHTPEHVSFLVTDGGSSADQAMGMISGDFIFVGDVGRPDLLESAAGQVGSMERSARVLYHSLIQFQNYPSYLQVWPGHGAGSVCGRSLGAVPTSTVGYEQSFNESVRAADDEDSFVKYINTGQPEPPPYFARMKKENRDGPAVLTGMPTPKHIDAKQAAKLAMTEKMVVIDTREWVDFRKGHLPKTIFAPLNKSFPTITGSYVESGKPICLIIEPEGISEAITDLIHVGLDEIATYTTPADLIDFGRNGGEMKMIAEIEMDELNRIIATDQPFILDVRRAQELIEFGHINTAHNIAHTRLLVEQDGLPTDQPIYIHCRSGVRSTYAAGFLDRCGYDVVHLAGGFLAWLETGGHVVAFT